MSAIPRLQLVLRNGTHHALAFRVLGQGPIRDGEGQFERIEIVIAEREDGAEPEGESTVWRREACELPGGVD